MRVSRRAVASAGGFAGLAGLLGLATAGCDSASGKPSPPTSGSTTRRASATPDPAVAADARLRERAITDERRLLAAAAAPAGAEPFATIRGLHRAHLRTLTGRLPADPAPKAAPAAALLVVAERTVASARRADCAAASADLAPLLASLSASAGVAVSLLAALPS
jgi:hypothetical protein